MHRGVVKSAMNSIGIGKVMGRHRVESRLQYVEQTRIGDESVTRIVTAGLACIDRQTHAANLLTNWTPARWWPFVQKIQQIFDGAKIARAGKSNGDGDGQTKLVHGIPPKWQRATQRGAALVQSFVEVCLTLISQFGSICCARAVHHG